MKRPRFSLRTLLIVVTLSAPICMGVSYLNIHNYSFRYGMTVQPFWDYHTHIYICRMTDNKTKQIEDHLMPTSNPQSISPYPIQKFSRYAYWCGFFCVLIPAYLFLIVFCITTLWILRSLLELFYFLIGL